MSQAQRASLAGTSDITWGRRTDKQKNDWKRDMRSKNEGDRFSYRVQGWQRESSNYVSDVNEIEFVVAKRGEIHCTQPGCENPQFGAEPNCRAEYNVYLHVYKKHKPAKKRKEGAANDATKGNNLVQGSIGAFFQFTKGGSPKKKKANLGFSPSSASTATSSAAASSSTLSVSSSSSPEIPVRDIGPEKV